MIQLLRNISITTLYWVEIHVNFINRQRNQKTRCQNRRRLNNSDGEIPYIFEETP